MERSKEVVVLLHGILGSTLIMKVLENFFKKNGYEVLNIGYPSVRHDLEFLADYVCTKISKMTDGDKKVNFVCHSMGGLVVRVMLNKYKFKNLGKLVFMGTPNSGSEIADLLKDNYFYKKLYGPAGQQLVTDQTAFNKLFGDVYYEVGCIAGVLRVDPLHKIIFKAKSDGRVSVESTKLEGMKDHAVLRCRHFYLPLSTNVRKLALRFIQTGSFKK